MLELDPYRYISIFERRKGFRGLVAKKKIEAGTIILCDPVAKVRYENVEKSEMSQYCFEWDGEYDAIAFGLSELINHSEDANVDIERNREERFILVRAVRSIEKGEEILYRYRCELWFEVE